MARYLGSFVHCSGHEHHELKIPYESVISLHSCFILGIVLHTRILISIKKSWNQETLINYDLCCAFSWFSTSWDFVREAFCISFANDTLGFAVTIHQGITSGVEFIYSSINKSSSSLSNLKSQVPQTRLIGNILEEFFPCKERYSRSHWFRQLACRDIRSRPWILELNYYILDSFEQRSCDEKSFLGANYWIEV